MLCKPQVVEALHSCFLYDRQGFLSDDVFQQLLRPLVAQLGGELPLEIVEQEIAEELRPSQEQAEVGLDIFGQAVIAAIVQMAVTANKDFLWKPLHHQVGTCLPLKPVTKIVSVIKMPLEHSNI